MTLITLGLGMGPAIARDPSGPREAGIIHPVLQSRLDPASREHVAAYVVMAERRTLEQLERLTVGLDARERRAVVAAELKRFAELSQRGVWSHLEEARDQGRVSHLFRLWMGNAILFEAEASVIEEIAALEGIQRIRPTSEEPAEQITDAAPAPPVPLPAPVPVGGTPVTANIVQLQAPQLWDIGADGTGILIGCIDSGTEITHPDLASRIWNNPGETASNSIDDDLNGYVDDQVGWDFADDDNDPTDVTTHGTQSAGVLVGDGSGGFITGMAPGASMLVCRIVTEADYWEAQQYCLDQGVDVVSSSLSFKWKAVPKPDYFMHRQMCEMELAAGIIHSNSIGNNGNQLTTHPIPFNIGTPGNCPPPFRHPESAYGGRSSTLGVAGIRLSDESLYQGSGQGPCAWEDITLYDSLYPHTQDPGQWDYPHGGFGGGGVGLPKPDLVAYTLVQTLTNGGGYDLFGGTSAATPHVGGGLALLLDSQPEALPRHLAAAIELTAIDTGSAGRDNRHGAGKVQIFDAARRLILLGRADELSPSIGGTTTFEVFGEANSVALSYFDTEIVPGRVLNILPPFWKLNLHPLGPTGETSFVLPIPNVPEFVGVTIYFQFFAGILNKTDWGPGLVASVPESFTISSP